MAKRGHQPGTPAPNRKLSDAMIVMLREYRQADWSHKDLSLLFGISRTTSSAICRGKIYREVGGPVENTRTHYAKRGKGI